MDAVRLAEASAILREANLAFAKVHPGESPGRQPVHTVYGGAHLFKADLPQKLGAVALRTLEEHAPDVILLDIEMPRMDGFEFTKMIKSMPRHAHIPIIMVTSRTAEKHRNRAKELGVDLYLGKPFQEAELLRNLREMLALTP